MSILTLQELGEQLQSSQTLADWLQVYAALTWTRIGFANHHPRLRFHETTLTQNLVFDCWLTGHLSHWGIKLFEAVDEAANCNDLEIAVETGLGYVLLPAQAKLSQQDGRYPGVSHKTGGRFQADLLMDYARKVQGWPLDLLYNHSSDIHLADRVKKELHMPLESYGISLCDAVYIKERFCPVGNGRWNIPRFADLHPGHAYPLHFLGCDINGWFPELQGEHSIKYYTREELKQNGAFMDLNPPPAIGNIPIGIDRTLKALLERKMVKPSAFNPKFRIMFSRKKEMARVWVMG